MSRPKVLEGVTIKSVTPCGKVYTTINNSLELVEVFSRLGKSGTCASAFNHAIGRVISIAMSHAKDRQSLAEDIIKTLKGNSCGNGGDEAISCPDAIGKALEIVFGEKK